MNKTFSAIATSCVNALYNLCVSIAIPTVSNFRRDTGVNKIGVTFKARASFINFVKLVLNSSGLVYLSFFSSDSSLCPN